MAKILVIRFSAIGDVAMTIPVIHSFATQYPQHEITILSRMAMKPLFLNMPANVTFFDSDLSGVHKGFKGVSKLFRQLQKEKFDYVADFHNVLRSKYLRLRFDLKGVKVAHIHKGRRDKEKLVRRHNKVFKNLKSSFQRYADVLQRLGFPLEMNFQSIYGDGKGDYSIIEPIIGEKGSAKWIGIAPFAKHSGKIYPIELQEQVVAHFAQRPDVRVFLFGGGQKEEAVFDEWTAKYPNLTSLIGKVNMNTELILMSYLNVMLSMDSANMHLASLVNTPVVSVWGATHPYAGFMGWNQSSENAVQVDLSCRPCSVYGQKPCWRGDYACMYQILPEYIIRKVESVIDMKS